MTVRFWGTRGSIPTPGRKTEKYGGNTSCLEVRAGDTVLILDAGSGIRELGDAWIRSATAPAQATLLFTHLHWDHVQGFPFFAPAYQTGNALTIFGEDRPAGGIRELLSSTMRGDFFPVPLAAMRASLDFRATTDEFAIGPLCIRTFRLPHPGGCLGYRIESTDGVLVFATDCELDLAATNQDEVRGNPHVARRFDPDLLQFCRGADLLVVDTQFLDGEYETRRGWGHNPVATVVDLCEQSSPKMVALFHHDPQHTDEIVSGIVADAFGRLERRGVRDMLVFAAREGVTMRVGRPRPPVKLAT
jgi:phosphoribosyl 1,2-cyclic phosphodiesterase